MDDFIEPQFYYHPAKKSCFESEEYTADSLNFRVAMEFLQGSGIGTLLPPYKKWLLGDRNFVKKTYNLVLSHSGNLTSRDTANYPFLQKKKMGSGDFYKPYLMGEQLFPRTSDILMRNSVFARPPWQQDKTPVTHPAKVKLHIMDTMQVLNLQEKWMAQIDLACTEYFLPKKWRFKIYVPSSGDAFAVFKNLMAQSMLLIQNPGEIPRLLVSTAFAAILIMQVWSNALGRLVLLTQRSSTLRDSIQQMQRV